MLVCSTLQPMFTKHRLVEYLIHLKWIKWKHIQICGVDNSFGQVLQSLQAPNIIMRNWKLTQQHGSGIMQTKLSPIMLPYLMCKLIHFQQQPKLNIISWNLVPTKQLLTLLPTLVNFMKQQAKLVRSYVHGFRMIRTSKTGHKRIFTLKICRIFSF